MDPEDQFDVIVVGTGLAQSLVAAAHARRGDKVLHVSPSGAYGGALASFTWPEFVALGGEDGKESFAGFSDFEHHGTAEFSDRDARAFAIELCPKLLYCQSAVVDLFSTTGVGRHLDFKLLEGSFIHLNRTGTTGAGAAATERVPASKEDVFSSKTISLMDKRRLMKFFNTNLDPAAAAAAGAEGEEGMETTSFREYLHANDLRDTLEDVFAYGVAMLTGDSSKATASAGLARTRKYLSALGRFGNSPFLASMYGGGSELAQSLCRVAAVYGGVYILGRPIASLTRSGDTWTLGMQLDGPNHPPHAFTAPRVVVDPTVELPGLVTPVESPKIEDEATHMAVLVTRAPVRDDAKLALFVVPPPPTDATAHAVQVLHMCADLRVCPESTYLLHARGTSRADIDRALELLVPKAEDRVHVTHFKYWAARATAAGEGVLVVPAPGAGIDLDDDVVPVIEQWLESTPRKEGEAGEGEERVFLAPLPNPDDEQVINEAQRILDAEGSSSKGE
ncbi:hypothetical protein H9P43_002806 [Blastocladiella emersonii ATCC 22665]|nr:hypothetical protein H9P43_002806 [Blastocladiella emersonii ATCC 22665]